jgi:hypothetical protein
MLKYNPMSNMQENPPEIPETIGTEPKLPEPNPVTQKRHNRDMVWQVYAPLTAGVIIVLLLMILTVNGTNYAVRKGADVSIIWLIAPALVISLIILAINAAAIYGIAQLIKVLPGYSRIVLDYFILAGMYVNKLGDRMVAPVLRVRTFNASLRQIGRSFRPKQE